MRFVGLDVHKRIIEAVILDPSGTILSRHKVQATREAIEEFARAHLRPDDRVALEATTNTWAVVDILTPHVAAVVISNPLRTRAIAEARIKTDKVDALVLAQLLRTDFLPTVWRPDPKTRQLRSLTSRRASLVQDRTGVKNRIHSLLHQRLIPVPETDLFGAKGREWLTSLSLDEIGQNALDSDLRLLDALEKEVDDTMLLIAQRGHGDPRVKLLLTLPGVDVAVAQTILATLGDVSRFPEADKAAAYFGLVPSTRQSANHTYHGPITKQGRSHARWMLVQAAQHVGTHPGPLGVFFRRVAKRKNRNVAVVATARKLVTIAWHMLKNNEPYRYAQPRATQTKLARLRVIGTGTKRRGGLAKGSSRPEAYGSGQGTRAVPSIDEVYAEEQIPALPPLSPGEKRVVQASGATEFVAAIHSTHRVPRRKAQPQPVG
jgi:transposase